MAFVIFWFFGRKRCALFFSSIWWGKEGVRIIRNCWSHMRNGRIWFLPKVVLWLFPGELRWPWRVFVPHLSPRLYGDVEWPYWNLPPRFYGAQRIAQWRRPSSVAFWTQNKNGAAFRSVFKDGQIQHLNFFFGFWMIWWILNGLSCKYSWMGCFARSQLFAFPASWLRLLAIGATAPSFVIRLKRGRVQEVLSKPRKNTHRYIYIYSRVIEYIFMSYIYIYILYRIGI